MCDYYQIQKLSTEPNVVSSEVNIDNFNLYKKLKTNKSLPESWKEHSLLKHRCSNKNSALGNFDLN